MTNVLEILSRDPELLVMEQSYDAGAEAPPPHYHPSQDEHFEVLEGSIHTRVGDAERTLGQGEQIEISRGTVHQMWNPETEPARVRWRTSPGGRTEEWFRAVDGLYESGRVGKNGMPSPLAFAVLLHEFDDTIRLPGPGPVIKPAIAGMAALGRARGYSA